MSHLLFKVTVTFSSFTSNVFMSALLLDDALKPATLLTVARSTECCGILQFVLLL